MLGYVFDAHPAVAVFNEPRTTWSLGNAYRPDDELGPEHLTPRIAKRIDAAFAEGLARKGGARFVEKTPSNTLRVPFLHALYPDGRFVHIVRDGRDVIRSLLLAETRAPRARRLRKRLAETPLLEWPALAGVALRTVWRTRVLRKPVAFWGPRPKGWRAWQDLPAHLRVARQWRACVEKALRDLDALPESCRLEIRYEDFVREPEVWTRRILEFCDLEVSAQVLDHVKAHVHGAPSAGRPSPLTPEQEREALEEMRPLLERLGYVAEAARPNLPDRS